MEPQTSNPTNKRQWTLPSLVGLPVTSAPSSNNIGLSLQFQASNAFPDIGRSLTQRTYSYCIVPEGYCSILVPQAHCKNMHHFLLNKHNDSTVKASTSSSSTETKKPVTTPEKRPPRPLNPFLLFRRDKQAEIFNKYQGISNSQVSQILGRMWKSASNEEKEKYQSMAEESRKLHKQKYPNYKYYADNSKQKNKKPEIVNQQPLSIHANSSKNSCHFLQTQASEDYMTEKNPLDMNTWFTFEPQMDLYLDNNHSSTLLQSIAHSVTAPNDEPTPFYEDLFATGIDSSASTTNSVQVPYSDLSHQMEQFNHNYE
ncbi:hypothetical protein K7432_004522 [Basidiobolus ranarum]|uniref:HMG box domain-containing protein n=1 Tax=Basidiobolus ranarum TaxID=34480 RepID=A0ABR2WY02_9FUNG